MKIKQNLIPEPTFFNRMEPFSQNISNWFNLSHAFRQQINEQGIDLWIESMLSLFKFNLNHPVKTDVEIVAPIVASSALSIKHRAVIPCNRSIANVSEQTILKCKVNRLFGTLA